jgi:hypothetical protein
VVRGGGKSAGTPELGEVASARGCLSSILKYMNVVYLRMEGVVEIEKRCAFELSISLVIPIIAN